MNAGMIAVVDDGSIVETGNHKELLAKNARYYDLVEAQSFKTSTLEAESEPPTEQDGIVDRSALVQVSEIPVIRFKDVFFSYPSRPNDMVFCRLNLQVMPGETLAIVGPSGSGKSTLVSLIECFYHPTKGSVEYNGIDLRNINIKWLRGDQLGHVGQEPVLFDLSVLENIRFGIEATQEQVEEAARQANCHDFIISFPDGYGTRVGAGSSLVSGGQKQRIAIARALLRKPRVLLLDESTASLDSQSEQIVQKTLDRIMFGTQQTCVVIAYRLSMIRNASRSLSSTRENCVR